MTEKKEEKARRGGEKRRMRSEGEIHEEIGKHLVDVIGGISEWQHSKERIQDRLVRKILEKKEKLAEKGFKVRVLDQRNRSTPVVPIAAK